MKRRVIANTEQTTEGEMLWHVKFESSYYDNDSRGACEVPVYEDFFVLAKNQKQALRKADPGIKQARKKCDKDAEEKVRAQIVTIEDLIPSFHFRWNYIPGEISPVELFSEEDTSRYKLGVCLIPI